MNWNFGNLIFYGGTADYLVYLRTGLKLDVRTLGPPAPDVRAAVRVPDHRLCHPIEPSRAAGGEGLARRRNGSAGRGHPGCPHQRHGRANPHRSRSRRIRRGRGAEPDRNPTGRLTVGSRRRELVAPVDRRWLGALHDDNRRCRRPAGRPRSPTRDQRSTSRLRRIHRARWSASSVPSACCLELDAHRGPGSAASGNFRPVNACTIIARNYLAQARVLARSFLEHHPGRALHGARDRRATKPFPKALDDDFDVLRPTRDRPRRARAPPDGDALRRHGARDGGQAVVPEDAPGARRGRRHLLRPGHRDLPRRSTTSPSSRDEHSIVLTPHTLAPLPHDRREPGEVTLLLAGHVQPRVHRRRRAGGAVPRLVGRAAGSRGARRPGARPVRRPALGRLRALALRAHRPAGPRLQRRPLEPRDAAVRARRRRVPASTGSRCGSSTSAASTPRSRHLLSKFLGPEPRILLSEQPRSAQICGEYGAEAPARPATARRRRSRTASTGCRTASRSRSGCAGSTRASSSSAETQGDGASRRTRSTRTAPTAFVAWLNEPIHPRAPGLTRYLVAAPCASAATFSGRSPTRAGSTASAILEWVWSDGRATKRIPVELLPDRPETADAARRAETSAASTSPATSGPRPASARRRDTCSAGSRRRDPVSRPSPTTRRSSRQAHAFDETGEHDVRRQHHLRQRRPAARASRYDVGPGLLPGPPLDRDLVVGGRHASRRGSTTRSSSSTRSGSEASSSARRSRRRRTRPVFTLPLGIELPTSSAPRCRATRSACPRASSSSSRSTSTAASSGRTRWPSSRRSRGLRAGRGARRSS